MNRLRYLRVAAQKTLAETALALGVSVDTVGRMERGKSKIGIEDIRILTVLFGCSEADFFGRQSAKPYHPAEVLDSGTC